MRGADVLSTLLEIAGLLLISAAVYLAWPPGLLALAGVLLVVGVEVRGRR